MHLYIFVYVFMGMCVFQAVCDCAPCACSFCKDWKRALGSLELELQNIMSGLVDAEN